MRKISLMFLLFLCLGAFAQRAEDKIKTKGFPKFPKIVSTDIPGAPILGQAVLINGTVQEIRTEKHGLAYPAFYDWNHDGKTDLLVGEFATGQTGSNIKVYLNVGTNKNPKYTGKYFYALDIKGDTITNYQWCCIGIHPRFVDMDGDGFADMLSGQYNPGLISWWRGSKDGFQPRQFIPQEAYVEKANLDVTSLNQLDPKTFYYWIYTAAGFADFNGDGLPDLFVGGFHNMRYALNEGTKEHPKFGMRQYILGLDGLPLSLVKPAQLELDRARKEYRIPDYGGLEKGFVTPVDWDGDGVIDLLVTDAYRNNKAGSPVVFFRGVQTDKGLRFEEGKPLFTTKEAKKIFPGCQPNITVTDYNHDGINDLVFGLSLPTVNGYQIDSTVEWNYLDNLGIESPGKDAGEAIEWAGGLDKLKKQIAEHPEFRSYYLGKLDNEKYLTLRHRGYVYVMLGKRNPVKAKPRKGVIAKEAYKVPLNQTSKSSTQEGPVTFDVKAPAAVDFNHEGTIEVTLNIKEGWHGYPDTEVSKAMGFIPTKVSFEFPDGFMAVGDLIQPKSKPKGTYEVYEGEGVKFAQKFRAGQKKNGKFLSSGEYTIKAIISYQVCNEEMCLPPVTENVELKVNYN